MASKTSVPYGRRLVPQVVDELAATVPDRVYASIPKTSNVQDGYQDVTMAEFAGCINFMARWLEEKFGRSETFETIAYVGLSDLKGITTLLAAIKVGYKVCNQEHKSKAGIIMLTLMGSSSSLRRATRPLPIST